MIMLLLDCTKNVFNAAVQVKRRKWRDRGTSSTKAFFFFLLIQELLLVVSFNIRVCLMYVPLMGFSNFMVYYWMSR